MDKFSVQLGRVTIYRSIPNGVKYACMFSGGKDSGLALAVTLSSNRNLHSLLHGIDLYDGTSLYHDQDIKIVQAQAEAIGVPLHTVPNTIRWTHWGKLVNVFRNLYQQGVEYIVYGTLFDEEYAKYHGTLCNGVGLKICMPLWNKTPQELMNFIKVHKIKSVITNIDARKLPSDFLGQVYDQNVYDFCVSLGLHPFGEYGEFHTTLVYSDYFAYPLQYRLGKITDQQVELLLVNSLYSENS